MHGFFVRTAAPGDLPAIADLLRETWHATYDEIDGAEKVDEITSSFHSVEALRPRLTRLNSEFLLADDASTIGGVAFAAAASDDAKLVVLHQLYVLPAQQGRGIGRDLLTEIVDCFPDASRLRVEVEEKNETARAFYERQGFAVLLSPAAGSMAGLQDGATTLVLERSLA